LDRLADGIRAAARPEVSRAQLLDVLLDAEEAGLQLARTTRRLHQVAHPARPEPETADREQVMHVAGTETILLAADSPAVRAIGRDLLEQFGYRVVPTETGLEALKTFL